MPSRLPRAPRALARRTALTAASFALGAFALSTPRLARAQSITIFQQASLPRLDASEKQVAKRDLAFNPEGVSYQDCKDGQKIRFTLQLAGFATGGAVGALEVWAGLSGNDCQDQTRRVGAAATCWKLGPNIPLQLQVDAIIGVREIMKGALNPQKLDDSEKICGQVDLTKIAVNFLYFAPGNPGTPAARAPVEISVDTIGPPPLSGVSVLPGNTRLNVRWNSVGEGGVQDLVNVRVFCAPVGSDQTSTETVCSDPKPVTDDAGTDDAGTDDAGTDDAGTDAGAEDGGCTTKTTTKAACSAAAFATDGGTDTIVPDKAFVDAFKCGELGGANGSGVTAREFKGKPLENRTTYAVAVAGTDSFGNGGTLSTVVCDYPEQTTDFWSEYRGAGGQAGGGYCSTPAAGSAAGSGVVAGVAALSLVSILRRRMQRKARAASTKGAAR
jgi:hypothetical protein